MFLPDTIITFGSGWPSWPAGAFSRLWRWIWIPVPAVGIKTVGQNATRRFLTLVRLSPKTRFGTRTPFPGRDEKGADDERK